jgi:hypothetical protein
MTENKLKPIWFETYANWTSTRNNWNDDVRSRFDSDFLVPLEQQAKSIIKMVDYFDQFINQAHNNLERSETELKKLEQQIRFLDQ